MAAYSCVANLLNAASGALDVASIRQSQRHAILRVGPWRVDQAPRPDASGDAHPPQPVSGANAPHAKA